MNQFHVPRLIYELYISYLIFFTNISEKNRPIETDQNCNYLAPVLASVLLINDSQLQILVTRCVILREVHV